MLNVLRHFAWFVAIATTAPLAAQPLPDWSVAELEKRIRAGELGRIRALAVEQHGDVVYRERFGNGAMGDRVDIRSAGKSITALAIGAAIADGSLSGTDVAVWPYLDATRGDPWDAITIADLLAMSSALDCNDWNKRSPGQEERMYRKRDWTAFVLTLPAREFKRRADGYGPFSYCTAGVFLLGQVVERATGERFDTYVQRRLFDRLDIDGANWRQSRSGQIQSGGQLTISDEALIKIGRMVLDRGMWDGRRVLPAQWIETMLTPHHQLGQQVHYAWLWWVTPIRSQRGYEAAFMMKGNGGNIVALVPTMDAVLVVQAENYNSDMAEHAAFTALTTMLTSLPVPSLGSI